MEYIIYFLITIIMIDFFVIVNQAFKMLAQDEEYVDPMSSFDEYWVREGNPALKRREG